MKPLKYITNTLFALIIAVQVAVAAGTDVDNLIDLLTQKGTITKEDAAGLKAGIAAKKDTGSSSQDFTVLYETPTDEAI